MAVNIEKLDNGITLIYRQTPLHVGSVMLLYGTGSLEESSKYAGTTHLIEHLTFNCTGIPQIRLNSEFSRIGAKYNAYTTTTCTCLWGYAPFKNLNVLSDMFLRMCRKFELTHELLNEERDVVLAELASIYSEPLARFTDNFLMSVLPDSNYTNPVIGNEKALRNLTVNDVVYYHSRAFTTDRLTVVIQSPESACPKEIRSAFDVLEPTSFRLDTSGVQRSDVLSGSKIYRENVPAAESTLSLYAFPVPVDDRFQTILSSAVSNSSDSYMYRKLRIDEQVAYDFSSYTIPAGDKTIFVIEVDHEHKHTGYVKEVLESITDFILNMPEADFARYKESRENRYLLEANGYSFINDRVSDKIISGAPITDENIDPDKNMYENFLYGDFRKCVLDIPEKGYYGVGGPEVQSQNVAESYRLLNAAQILKPKKS